MADTPGPGSAPHAPRPYFPGGERMAFFVFLVVVLYGAWVTIEPVALALLVAAAAASLSYRGYEWLAGRLGGRRRTAAAISVLLLVVLVFGPLVALLWLTVRQVAAEIAQVLPRLAAWPEELQRRAQGGGRAAALLRAFLDGLDAQVRGAMPAILGRVGQWAGFVGSKLLAAVIGAFLFVAALYYFYLDGRAWLDRLVRVLPLREHDARDFLVHFREVSLAVFVGGVGTALIQGLAAWVGYGLLRVDTPLLWAVLTGAASFVPIVGTALVWAPLAASLIVSGAWVRGLLLVGYGLGVVSVIDNFAHPLLTRVALPMHPLLVFVAVFGGLAAFGLPGLFFGPLLVATALAALRIYERRAEEGGAPTTGDAKTRTE